jgi:DNA-directed RNA polymerase subunit F
MCEYFKRIVREQKDSPMVRAAEILHKVRRRKSPIYLHLKHLYSYQGRTGKTDEEILAEVCGDRLKMS